MSRISLPVASSPSGPRSLIELVKCSQSDLMGQVTAEGRRHQNSSKSSRATDANFRLGKYALFWSVRSSNVLSNKDNQHCPVKCCII